MLTCPANAEVSACDSEPTDLPTLSSSGVVGVCQGYSISEFVVGGSIPGCGQAGDYTKTWTLLFDDDEDSSTPSIVVMQSGAPVTCTQTVQVNAVEMTLTNLDGGLNINYDACANVDTDFEMWKDAIKAVGVQGGCNSRIELDVDLNNLVAPVGCSDAQEEVYVTITGVDDCNGIGTSTASYMASFIIREWEDYLEIVDAPADVTMEACQDDIASSYANWLIDLQAAGNIGSCGAYNYVDTPIEELRLKEPVFCMDVDQVVTARLVAKNNCKEAETTSTFLVKGKTELELTNLPTALVVTTAQCEDATTKWNTWISGLEGIGASGCTASVIFEPELSTLQPTDICDMAGRVHEVEFYGKDECGETEKQTASFTFGAYSDHMALTNLDGALNINYDACANVADDFALWKDAIRAIGVTGGCNPRIEYSDVLDDLVVPEGCSDQQQEVYVSIRGVDDCDGKGTPSPDFTAIFIIRAYVDDLEIVGAPEDVTLESCESNIGTLYSNWLTDLESSYSDGTCGDDLRFDPSLEDLLLEEPLPCVDEDQVISVQLIANNTCKEVIKTSTFLVKRSLNTLRLENVPNDLEWIAEACESDIQDQYNNWYTELAAVYVDGDISSGVCNQMMEFDPPLPELENMVIPICPSEDVNITVRFKGVDACEETAEISSTFIVKRSINTLRLENVPNDLEWIAEACDSDIQDQYNNWYTELAAVYVDGDISSGVCNQMMEFNPPLAELENLVIPTCPTEDVNITVRFKGVDDCEETETITSTFLVKAKTTPELTNLPESLNVTTDPCEDPTSKFDQWIAGLEGIDSEGSCHTEVIFDKNLNTISVTTEHCALTEDQVIAVAFYAEDGCGQSETMMASFRVPAYDNSLEIQQKPAEVVLESCQDNIEDTYNSWLDQFEITHGHGSCSDDLVLEPSLDELKAITFSSCATTDQVVNVELTARNNCDELIETTSFTVKGYENTLHLIQVPGDLDWIAEACEDIDEQFDNWIAELENVLADGDISSGICDQWVEFDPPLASLARPTTCPTEDILLEVSYKAVDNCGESNEITSTFLVHAYANSFELSEKPDDVTINACDDDLQVAFTNWVTNLDDITIIDGGFSFCESNVTYDPPLSDLQTPESCATETQIYSIEIIGSDKCGSTEIVTARFEVTPNLPPVFNYDPENDTFECGTDPGWATDPIASDCGSVDLSVETEEAEDDVCAGDGYWRIWTARDNCGLETQVSQFMRRVDTTLPYFDFVPENDTYECGEGLEFGAPIALDGCSFAVSITSVDETIGSNCAGDIVKRTWTATDDCNNAAEASQTLTPEITVPLTLENVPSELDITIDACSQWSDFDDWKASLEQITVEGCNGEVEFTPSLASLVDPGTCLETDGVTSVSIRAVSECEALSSSTITASFTRRSYANDLHFLNTPDDVELEACADDIESQFNAWQTALRNVKSAGTCSDEMNFSPAIEDLVMPSNCSNVDQVVSIELIGSNTCDEIRQVATFTVRGAQLLSLQNVPAILDITTQQCEDATTKWNTWISGLQAISANGGCNPTVVFNKPLTDLEPTDICDLSGRMHQVEFYAEDDCGQSEKQTATFTFGAYSDHLELTNLDGNLNINYDACANVADDFALWKDAIKAIGVTGGCNPRIDYSEVLDDLVAPVGCADQQAEVYVTIQGVDDCDGKGTPSPDFTASFIIRAYVDDLEIVGVPGNVILEACQDNLASSYESWLNDLETSYSNGTCGDDLTIEPSLENLRLANLEACQDADQVVTVQLTANNTCKEVIATSSFTVKGQNCQTINTSRTTTAITCHGLNDGKVSIQASGGVGDLSIIWSDSNSDSFDRENLSPGTYAFTVTDANGCTSTGDELITEPFETIISASATDVLCSSTSSGSISLAINNGGPWTYQWSSGETSKDISDLEAGTYRVTVTDVNGCENTAAAEVKEPVELGTERMTTTITCHGLNDGKISIEATGGVGPFTITWDDSNSDSFDRENLSPGLYAFTVTDANGCTSTGDELITEPLETIISASATDVLCNSASTGSISLTMSNGGPWTYKWNTGSTSKEVSNLEAGMYSVTVTDVNGCENTAMAEIKEPTAITFETSSTDANCQQPDGTATVSNIQGGTAPYTIVWSDQSTGLENDGLTSGSYEFTITDAGACTSVGSITVGGQNGPLVSTSIQDVSCNGEDDGVVTVSVSGGQAPYTYSGTDAANSPMLTNVFAGSYIISAEDVNGCVVSTTVLVGEPDELGASRTTTAITCHGLNDGKVSIEATGGVGPFTIMWDDSNSDSFDRENLSPGLYAFTVTDAKGCTSTGDELITEPLETIISASATDVLCSGTSTGSIALTITNGGPWTYQWNTGSTSRDISDLEAGMYSVTVTDVNGCENTAMAEIKEPTAITFETSSTDANCQQPDGTATVSNIQGGTAPYTIVWSDQSTGLENDGLTSGSYEFTITDAGACTSVGAVTVDGDQSGPSISTSIQDVSCNGENDGVVTVSVSGGPWTYQWSSGETSKDISDLEAGTYRVTVTDVNGCENTAAAEVKEPVELGTERMTTAITCHGLNDGKISIEGTGGTGDLTIMWGDSNSDSFDRENLSPGLYAFTVTDAKGCTSTGDELITEPLETIISASATDVLCSGTSTGSIALTITNGGPWTYQWNTGSTSRDISDLEAGMYSVTVTNANGCKSTAVVEIKEPTAITFETSSTDANCQQPDGTATVSNIQGGTAPYTIVWSDQSTGLENDGLTSGGYEFTITDAGACTSVGSITVGDQNGPSISTSIQDVSCNGENDGVVTVSVSGGQAPYTYSGTDASDSNILSNVKAGSYTVSIQDANGCSVSTMVTLAEPDELFFTATVEGLSCQDNSAGRIDVEVGGGSGQIEVIWSNGSKELNQKDLMAGTYAFTLTDENNCKLVSSMKIEELSNCDLDGDGVDDVTEGEGDRDEDGIPDKEDFDPTGYFYCEETGKIIDGATVDINGPGNVNLIHSGSNGFYQFFVDAPGHYVMTVNLPSNYTLSTTCLPSGTVDPSGQPNPYVLGNDEVSASGFLSSSDCTPYYFEFEIESGDPYIFNNNIPVKGCGCANEKLKLLASATPASCDNDGTATAEATGGVAPYTYEWDNGMSGATLTGLTPGMYNVTATDGCGDTKRSAAYVKGDKIEISFEGKTVSEADQVCELTGVSSHALWLNHFIGKEAKYFHFGTELGSLVQRADGTATVTGNVYDTSNPSSGFTMEIHLKDAKDWTSWSVMGGQYKDDARYAGMDYVDWTYYHLDEEKSKLNGFGEMAGIELSMTHRPKDRRYGFQIGQGADDKTPQFGMSGWFYYHGAYEGHGDLNVGVSCGEPVMLECAKSIALDCADGTTNIDIEVTGATAYTFNWSNGATTQNLTGVGAGKYSITVTSGTNCLATTSVCVTAPTAISVSSVIVDATTNGGNDGSIDLTVSGGTLPYAYMWSNSESSEDLSDLIAGAYIVTITDASGCTITENFLVVEPSAVPIEDDEEDVKEEDNEESEVFQLDASDGAFKLAEDESLSITITSLVQNTSDLSSTFKLLSSTINGQIALDPDGRFDYLPSENFNGTDQFTYEVCVDSLCKQGVVILDIVPVNDAPITTLDYAKVVSNVQASSSVLRNDIDVDGDQLVITSLDFDPTEVAAKIENDLVVFQSAEGFNGLTRIEYSISDQQGGEATGILEVQVDAPLYEKPEVSAYPNPFNGKTLELRFSGSYRQHSEFFLIDDLGRQKNLGKFNLNRLTNDVLTVDLTQIGLQDAVYFLRIVGEKDIFNPVILIVVE